MRSWRQLLGYAGRPEKGILNLYGQPVRPDFSGILGNEALQKLLDEYDFVTVCDVGSGACRHAELFARYGKKVTAVDLGRSCYHQQKAKDFDVCCGNYLDISFEHPFDCIWACHVLEHQPNPNLFLCKIHRDLKESGVLCITVPPLKHEIVGGHVTLWNAGLLLYHLILAGFSCRHAAIKQYGYNISVILRKQSIAALPDLDFDRGDVNRLAMYLPAGLTEGFQGDITELNW